MILLDNFPQTVSLRKRAYLPGSITNCREMRSGRADQKRKQGPCFRDEFVRVSVHFVMDL